MYVYIGNMTVETLNRLREKGYSIELQDSSEYAEITKIEAKVEVSENVRG